MIWLRCFGKAVFLAIAFGIAIESMPYLFPIPLFLIIAYGYQAADWVKGNLRTRSIGSFLSLRKDSCREGLSALAVLFFSFAIFALAGFIIFLGALTAIALIAQWLGSGEAASSTPSPAYDMGYALGRAVSGEENDASLFFWTIAWIGVATALYRYEEWAQQRKRSRKLKKLPRPTTQKAKPAPVDPIDLELDKTRADLGLLKMKKAKKKNI